jgi:hypothetical protein
MRYLRMIAVSMLLIVGLGACGPAESTPVIPGRPEAQTPTTPGATPEGPPAQPSNPLLTPEEPDMPSPITPDAAAQKMVSLAKEHLAQKLGIPVEQIALSEVRPVVWRDASLGCPKPAIDYIQVETPGFNILLEAGGQTYNYHTNQSSRFVMCNRP